MDHWLCHILTLASRSAASLADRTRLLWRSDVHRQKMIDRIAIYIGANFGRTRRLRNGVYILRISGQHSFDVAEHPDLPALHP